MRPIRCKKILLAGLLMLLLLLTLASCNAEERLEKNHGLGRAFMDHVLQNDYDGAYAMVKETVTEADFGAYWTTIVPAAEGAEHYEMTQTGWNLSTENGRSLTSTTYEVELDNSRTVLLRVVTAEDIEGIAGIHFSDVTDFLTSTAKYLPTLRVVMGVFSGLALLFMILMLVDCLRRKMRYKVLWIILILCGIGVTFSVGEGFSSEFFAGLMIEASTATADPWLRAVEVRLMVPMGAVLYLFLRKKFTVDPQNPNGDGTASPETLGAEPTEESTEDVTVESTSDEGEASAET